MSGTEQERCDDNVVNIGSSEADAILQNVRSLRDAIVTAWRERAVVLSSDEREMLHNEITQTCSFLSDLTRRR